VTRRVFLFLVFDWLFFWRYRTIAGIRFRRIREGRSRNRYLLIHGNEETARQVLKQHMKRHAGVAHLVTSEERNVRIRGAMIDPNRLFSRVGAEVSLRRLNPDLSSAQIYDVLQFLDRERPKLLQALIPSEGGLLIATHNNSQGYSLTDEIPISDKIAVKQPDQPHEFFLCTHPDDFEKIVKGPYNVVLQNSAPPDDDGSLSRLAGKQGVRYCNLEVALGKEAIQREMLDWLVRTIG
jgi:hypothetical protein